MKYDLRKTLMAFNGDPIKLSSKEDAEDCTVKAALELACVNCANPEYTKTGAKKYEVYKLLQRVHAADEIEEFSAEEVTMLKTLVADFFPVSIVGAVWDILEGEGLAL